MHLNNRQKIYWSFISSQIPRLIAQLDRNPLSTTYGSFDRKYWHQRFTDFSSASLQQGVETLSFLYQFKLNENKYYKSEKILDWIEASVIYTKKIQNKDGSFDEWYVGEHGWAGPTSYILNSLYQSYQYSGKGWSQTTVEAFETIFKRAHSFIANFEESHVLSNHQAIALLSLKQIEYVLKDKKAKQHFDHLLKRFIEHCNKEEGWSLEYDGADPGYQTATISFLARLDLIERNEEVCKLVDEQLEFVSHFAFPGFRYGEGLGSRTNANVFFFGFEHWARKNNLANKLSCFFNKGLENRSIIAPQDQEDHYLIYKLPELAMSLQYSHDLADVDVELPFQKSEFFSYQESSGFCFVKKANLYIVIDCKHGGRYRGYECLSGELIASEGDLYVKYHNKFYTDGAGSSVVSCNIKSITIRSQGSVHTSKNFNTYSLILFKFVFSLLSRWPKLALQFKSQIRKLLMYSKSNNKINFVKTIHLKDDCIEIINAWNQGELVLSSYSQSLRYVPQSAYFFNDELCHKYDADVKTRVISCVE